MRELAIQSANDTLTSNDRLEIQKEVVRCVTISIALPTIPNSIQKLLDGSQVPLSCSSAQARGLVVGAASEGGDTRSVLPCSQAGLLNCSAPKS